MSAVLQLTLMTTLASAPQNAVTAHSRPLQINVAVYDEAVVPSTWLKQAQDEMRRIYGEIGVNVVWQVRAPSSAHGDAPQGDRAALAHQTFLIMIRSRAQRAQAGLSPNAMGFASGTAEERARVVYLFYDRIEQFPTLHRGRMLGHIMAHEIGHALLPFQSHSPQGLMRAQWDRTDLELAQFGRLRFTPEQGELIRLKVSQLAERATRRPR
jgi:hypothetical protein